MTTISVALTTYNGAGFLPRQLDSILTQTRRPDELVVVDDQSSDDTCAILAGFAATAPFPVRLHRNDRRLGWRGNFMHALSLCGSDLIALCDQDDVWHPDKLATAVAALEQPDAVLFFHDAWLIDRAGTRIGPAGLFASPAGLFAAPAGNPPLTVSSFFSPYGFSMVCARSLLQLSDLWERSTDSNNRADRAPHDQWLFFLATVFGTVVYSDLRLADYRQHGNNAVGPPGGNRLLPRLRARCLYWLINPERRFAELAAVARDRAAILADSRDRLTGAWRDRAVAGERYWLMLATRFDSRARLYACAAMPRRAARLFALYREGIYHDGSGRKLNRSVVVKDAVFGVLLRPWLWRPETEQRA